MPEELMFPSVGTDFEKQSIIELNGVQLLVQQTDNSQYEIIRLMSSDPQHYLDSQLCPGQKITMSFSIN
ncbi:YlzJ-like family protein [Metabacillus niabensis]|nr:YlzJ-like family protein [Metabacillus niabensis]